MSEFGEIPTAENIINEHNKITKDKHYSDATSSLAIQENLKLIWLKFKDIKEDIENVKMMFRANDIGDHRKVINEVVRGIDYNVTRGDHYLKELLEDFQLRGKTGVFDLENIKKMIANQEKSDADKSVNNNIIMNDQLSKNTEKQSNEIKKKTTLKLKPIGKPYNDKNREVVLANNKMDDNLYMVDLTNKKVISQPRDIEDLYTDDVGNQKIAIARTKKNETYFIDTFNKKIFSGPFLDIKDVFMTHRYQNLIIAQILSNNGDRYFISIIDGKKINPNEFY